MRRNVMGRVIGRSWRVAVSGPDRPRVEFSTLVTEPTSKPLRLGDRVSLRACRMGLIRALSTHPIEPNTPYAMYLGWYYTVECLEGEERGQVYEVPGPLIGRVFTVKRRKRQV
jgi:hypothetical protein